MQVGGHIELDETPWQAVEHELREESGYTLAELSSIVAATYFKGLHTRCCISSGAIFRQYAHAGQHRTITQIYATLLRQNLCQPTAERR